MLWIPHQLVGAPLGYAVTLECYTEAHPTSLNYWAREDGLMIHESSKYKATSSPDTPSYKTHMTLMISNIQKDDYGSYKCIAKNPRGETDGTIRLYSKCLVLLPCCPEPYHPRGIPFTKVMTVRRELFGAFMSRSCHSPLVYKVRRRRFSTNYVISTAHPLTDTPRGLFLRATHLGGTV
ncbi:Lachesin [Camponotus floridanus]|uniref:Lachesin n=1 Tax=Camponotus floridanus TaxID=104421 RepID=E1ZVQ6_CAMFO|nr:Lachesin [Camponotus floridanus]